MELSLLSRRPLQQQQQSMNGMVQSGQGNMAAGYTVNIAWLFFSIFAAVRGDHDFPLLMPKVRPTHEEAYLCTPIRLSDTETFYVTKFTPNATAHTAHHMLVSESLQTLSRRSLTNLDR